MFDRMKYTKADNILKMHSFQVQHLQKVLIKKRDPVTHVCFIDELAKAKVSSCLRYLQLTTTSYYLSILLFVENVHICVLEVFWLTDGVNRMSGKVHVFCLVV